MQCLVHGLQTRALHQSTAITSPCALRKLQEAYQHEVDTWLWFICTGM